VTDAVVVERDPAQVGGCPVNQVHHLRHTTATLLKNLRVPTRDAQLILGHSRLA